MPLKFVAQTPPGVRTLVEALISKPRIPPTLRVALERFAETEAMSDFWPRILAVWNSRYPEGGQRASITKAEFCEAVIQHAIEAYERAVRVKKSEPRPASKVKISIDGIGRSVRDLRMTLHTSGGLVSSNWDELWRGKRDFHYNDFVETIESFEKLIGRIRTIQTRSEEIIQFPLISRKRLPDVFFSRAMGAFFKRFLGQPHVPSVLTLTEVAFDLKGSLHLDTVRKRLT